MKKSHRVAHGNQRRGGFCYYYTFFIITVKISFRKIIQKRYNSFKRDCLFPDSPSVSLQFLLLHRDPYLADIVRIIYLVGRI